MSFTADLREILRSWPYDPENDARIIAGEDGRKVLQVRTLMGIEQYELEGRPDGERPRGKESALGFHLARFEEAKKKGREAQFKLSARDCGELFHEGTLYYFRYVRLFQLKEWASTVRDTARNLQAFDFIHQHAAREEDRMFLEKWRPYILRVNATAAAMLALEQNNHARALRLVTEVLQKIEDLRDIEDETFSFERERSLAALRELREEICRHTPRSELQELEDQLRKAIETQEFERAALLRDRIRQLRKTAS